jgi:hypothetical protein
MDFFDKWYDEDFTYNKHIKRLRKLARMDKPYLPFLYQSKIPFFHMNLDYDMDSVKNDILELYHTATEDQIQTKTCISGEKGWYAIKLNKTLPTNLEKFITKFTKKNENQTFISVVKANGGFIGAHTDHKFSGQMPLHKQRFGVQFPKECKLVTEAGSTNLQDCCTFFNTHKKHGVYNKSSLDKVDFTFWFDYHRNKSILEDSARQSIKQILENIG